MTVKRLHQIIKPMKKQLKTITPQDIAEWQREVENIKPLPSVEEPPQAPLIIDEITPKSSEKGLYNHNSFDELVIGDTANIDGNLADKFVKGQLKIEARLDLHGLSEKEAFAKVRDFIIDSYHQGRRCVLIITGKGERVDPWWESKGVIKQSFPRWLNHADIRPYLLSSAPAKPSDGGTGAFYCLLKRQR